MTDAAPAHDKPLEPVATPDAGVRYRHRRSGGVYVVLHRGRLEADLSEVVVYRSEAGAVWVRPAAEFDDGRFERLADDWALSG